MDGHQTPPTSLCWRLEFLSLLKTKRKRSLPSCSSMLGPEKRGELGTSATSLVPAALAWARRPRTPTPTFLSWVVSSASPGFPQASHTDEPRCLDLTLSPGSYSSLPAARAGNTYVACKAQLTRHHPASGRLSNPPGLPRAPFSGLGQVLNGMHYGHCVWIHPLPQSPSPTSVPPTTGQEHFGVSTPRRGSQKANLLLLLVICTSLFLPF